MKKLTFFLSAVTITLMASCNSGEKHTERTVIDRDTVAGETEYKVEKKIREKTVTIDTVTETETVTDTVQVEGKN